MPNEQKPHSFWTSIPGILTAVAALLTATGGLIVAFKQFSPPRVETASAVTPTPARDTPLVVTPTPARDTASTVTPTPSTSRMGPLIDGVAYLQADIYSRATNNAAECSELWASDPDCKAMTFIKSQRLCWIKNSVPGTALSSDMVSAAKVSR